MVCPPKAEWELGDPHWRVCLEKISNEPNNLVRLIVVTYNTEDVGECQGHMSKKGPWRFNVFKAFWTRPQALVHSMTECIKKKNCFVNRLRKMVSFELGKEMQKGDFRLVTSVWQKKKFWVPMGNWTSDLQCRVPMLYHWATETLRWARSITKFLSILLGLAMLIASCL